MKNVEENDKYENVPNDIAIRALEFSIVEQGLDDVIKQVEDLKKALRLLYQNEVIKSKNM